MLKTYKDWVKSQQDLKEFLGIEPCEIDFKLYDDQLMCVPPEYYIGNTFEVSMLLQVGEVYTHQNGIPFYFTFKRTANKYYYLGILPEFKQKEHE